MEGRVGGEREAWATRGREKEKGEGIIGGIKGGWKQESDGGRNVGRRKGERKRGSLRRSTMKLRSTSREGGREEGVEVGREKGAEVGRKGGTVPCSPLDNGSGCLQWLRDAVFTDQPECSLQIEIDRR